MSAPRTLTEALAQQAHQGDLGVRLIAGDESERLLSWAELHRRARELAGGLRALGLRPQERVLLIFPTGAAFFEAFFGALLAGAVPVPVYPPLRLGRMQEYHERTARMIAVCGARLVLSDARVRRVLGPTLLLARPALGCLTLEDCPRAPLEHAGHADDLALVQFSSGTTVDPKPVALSHRAILAQGALLVHLILAADPHTVQGVSWLPLYHDMGLIGGVMPALLRPGVLNLLEPEVFLARPALWLRALSRHRATVSPAPNFAYSLCVDRVRDEELEGVDLSAWRLALNGAEPVAPVVLRAFQQRFARWGLRPEALTPVYGLAEAALAVTFSAADRPFTTRRFDREALAAGLGREHPEGQELVSVGEPVPGFVVQIRDEAGEVLPEGCVGRVWARGPSLMDGYLGLPEATRAALVEGWLDTGDQGMLVEGELYLTGRHKDLILLRGRNHAPHPLEQAVDAVPGVRRGCAAAVSHLPEGDTTERLLVLVEHAQQATEEELAAMPAACAQAVLTATGLDPDLVLVLAPGTLPRTSSGKIRRGEALRRHLAGSLTPPEAITPLRMAGMLAQSALAFARLRLGR